MSVEDHTPTDPIPALRPSPRGPRLDEEVTPVAGAALEEEATPVAGPMPGAIDEATPIAAARPAKPLEEATAVADSPMGEPLRLPRTGMEEVDAAIGDLERALNQLVTQERRLLAVIAGTFVCLFLPWFQLYNQGSRGPTTAMPGLEAVGFFGLLLLVLLGASLLVRAPINQLLGRRATWLRRGLHIMTILWLADALGSQPGVGQPWRYSFWVILPAAAVLLLLLGLLGRLPTLSPLRRK